MHGLIEMHLGLYVPDPRGKQICVMNESMHEWSVQAASGDTSPISWNFAKFLVKKDGTVFGR